MANYYIGEISIFAGNYPPADWLLCQGQLLVINDYTLLYSLLGTRYGGDGITTFGLPDLRSRLAVGAGQRAGSMAYTQGQTGGTEMVTLQQNNLPVHSHTKPVTAIDMDCYSGAGNTNSPQNNYPATITGKNMYATALSSGNITLMPTVQNIQSTDSTGDNEHINLIQPVFGSNFIICFNGDLPPTI
jgi:microcystin-dependent protein